MKPLLVVLSLFILLTACATPTPPSQLEGMLRPHYKTHVPSGDGPFPAVMLLHSCFGQDDAHGGRWGKMLARHGYFAIEIDSYTPRKLTAYSVCVSHTFAGMGNRLASDVLVTLAYLKTVSSVDPNKIAAIGFSAGGWSALDSLALAPPNKLPSSLTEAPPGGIEGLKAVIAFYPWCTFPAAHRNGWDSKVPVLILLAGEDTVVSAPACIEVAEAQKSKGFPVDYHVYPGASHWFDGPKDAIEPWRQPGSKPSHRFDPGFTTDAETRVLRFLGKAFK